MNFTDLDSQQLLDLYCNKANDLSYYNCAESDSWYQEAMARQTCQSEFNKIRQEIINRELPIPKGDWLI